MAWVSPRSLHLTQLSLTGIDVAHLCRNSGLCVDTGNTHFCRCQAGYTGSYCEEQVDECSPNPCQNGATCTDYLGGYSCEVGAWGARIPREKASVTAFLLPKVLPLTPHYQVGDWGVRCALKAMWEWKEPL